MIRKFIAKLIDKARPKSRKTDPHAPTVYQAAKLAIDTNAIPGYATKVTQTLQTAGYQAFIVGGAVRDLLLGIVPKDFDVATNATPEQVQALFRRSRIIGRRFQIVHVGFGEQTVEVSTFRALVSTVAAPDAEPEPEVVTEASSGGQQSEQHLRDDHGIVGGRSRRREGRRTLPVAQTRSADESGRLLRDNIFGSQHEDAARRDFTINALFYDPAKRVVLDYHGGVADVKDKRLRIIGDPATRYREDPVRMLRAVRFAGKLGFTLDAETRAPIAECADLILNCPKSRLFDEILKLLFCGNAKAAITQLRAEGLHGGLLPLLDTVLDSADGERFIDAALASTDARIKAGKPTSPGFLFAALLWPQTRRLWKLYEANGLASLAALFAAAEEVLSTQTENLAIQRRFVTDMKEIWSLQPRFEKRVGRSPFRLLEQPRFRAGYDFLLLRTESDELPAALGDWWTAFIDADNPEREQLIADLDAKSDGPAKKRRRRKRKPAGSATATATDDAGDDDDQEAQ